MRNLLLNIGYDGADYHGWQVQKNAVTVQEVFQNAVEKVFGARLPVKGCSRTDSGVHANCYFVSFQTELSIACDGVVRALNTVLPKDIAVLDCREVPLDFHPRYCCREKEYVYKLYNGAIRDPFLLRYAYQYRSQFGWSVCSRGPRRSWAPTIFAAFAVHAAMWRTQCAP